MFFPQLYCLYFLLLHDNYFYAEVQTQFWDRLIADNINLKDKTFVSSNRAVYWYLCCITSLTSFNVNRINQGHLVGKCLCNLPVQFWQYQTCRSVTVWTVLCNTRTASCFHCLKVGDKMLTSIWTVSVYVSLEKFLKHFTIFQTFFTDY